MIIIIIARKLINGKWFNIDGNEIYSVDQLIEFQNGQVFKVQSINGSNITLELVVENNG